MFLRSTVRTIVAGTALAVIAGMLSGPVQAASPPLVPGESVGQDPDEEWWEGITIPTDGVLPDDEIHPSSYVDEAGIDTLRARVTGDAPDPHGHYALAWDRIVADADAAASGAVDDSDNVKTMAAKATAFAWLITGEQRYLDAAAANLSAAFETIMQTDQYVAQQMTNYALAYDWVAADLSAEQDAAIRAAVKQGADWLFEYLDDDGVRSHNHRSKAGAALGSWALVFSADSDAQAYLDRSLENMNRVFRYMFTEDGIYRDGAGYYWIFTIINSTPFLWQYRNVSGVDLFPALQPAFEWQLKTVNPKGLMPPLDDGWYKVTWLNTVAAAYADTPTELSDTGTLGELFQWQFFASDLNAARYPDDWTGARDQFYGWPEEIALYDSTIAEVAPDDHTGTIDMNEGPRGGDTIFRSDWQMDDPATRWGYFGGVAMSNNHDHADGLQFLVDAENTIFARDNGYGPRRFGGRDEWKGPEHHNVVTADGAAVGDPTPTRGFLSGGGFSFAEKSAAYWNDEGATHTRSVAFPGSDYFVVLDRMAADTDKTWDAYWHVRGDLSGVANRRTWTTSDGPWGDAARMHSLTLPADVESSLVTDQFNPYGTGTDTGFEGYPDPSTDVEETTGIRLTQQGETAELLSVLVPASLDGPEPRLLDLGGDDVVATRIDTADYVDTVVAPRTGNSAEAGGLTVEAGLGWARTVGGALAGWAVHDGVSASWQGRELVSASAPVTMAAEIGDPTRHTIEVAATDGGYQLSVAASAGRPLVAATLDGEQVPAAIVDGRVVAELDGGGELVLEYGEPDARPATPTGLTATPYAGAVELSWDAVDTATSYRVLRRGKQIAEVDVPAYEDTDATDGTIYPYRVVAVNEAGAGRPSIAVTVRAGMHAPAVPEGLVASASHRRADLSWLPVRDAESYDVLRAVGDGDLTPVAEGLTDTVWTDTSVSNGTTYRYAVRAVNAVAGGPVSTEVTATPSTTPPDVPDRLTAARSAGSVTLAWDAAERADSYQVLRGALAAEAFDVVATTDEQTWTDTDVVDGTGYAYQVVAENDAGISDPARTVTAVPGCSLVHEVGPEGAVIEAEQYSGRSGAYELADDLDRYGGRVAVVPRGSEHKNDPDLWGRYDIEVEEAGRYFVAFLGYGESGSNDSVYVSVDNSTPTTVNLSVGDWFYRQSPIGFDLEPGFHTLLIKSREDGAMVDRFVVHPSGSIPDSVRYSETWTLPANPECGDGSGEPAAPEAVTSLTATATDEGVSLAWSGSRLAASYTVLGDDEVVATGVTATTWTDPEPGSASYVVVATNAAGDAPPSDPVEAQDSGTPGDGETVHVSTSSQLSAALASASAGDRIVLADGDYEVAKVTGLHGTAEAPIVIEAADRGGAVVTEGQLELLDSSHVTIAGLAWRNSNTLKIHGSHHIRLTRNHFRLAEENSLKWVIIQGEDSHHNRIDHNLFEDKHELGNFITIDGSSTQQSQHDRIDHNHFRNIGPRAQNEMEAIRVGWSAISQSSGYTVIEHNLFEDADGDPEIVSVKSCDNIVRYNTFRTSQGVLSARHGDRNVFDGNFFLGEGKAGTGGIRLYGKDQVVVNNYFEGLTGSGHDAALQIDGGDVDTSGSLSSHWRVYRALVAFNTFVDNASTIEIGTNYPLAPVDTTVAHNIVVGSEGPLISENREPVGMSYEGNIAHPTGSATVGVTAEPEQILVTDPLLDQIDGLWRLGEDSPAIDAAGSGFDVVVQDMDGQSRIAPMDIGADEYSTEPVVRGPLDAADVGVDAS